MKYQVLFSLKNNEKVFVNVVCCSCDCTLRVKLNRYIFRGSKSTIFLLGQNFFIFWFSGAPTLIFGNPE